MSLKVIKMNLPQMLMIIFVVALGVRGLPDQFSWDNVNGTSFVPETHSQNFPMPCNSGWAFSAADVFNSRMKIRRKAASPDLEIAVQVLLSCDEFDYGCMGVTFTLILGRTHFCLQMDQKE